MTKLDVNEFTEEQVAHYKKKDFWWEGVSFKDENGAIKYRHPDGSVA